MPRSRPSWPPTHPPIPTPLVISHPLPPSKPSHSPPPPPRTDVTPPSSRFTRSIPAPSATPNRHVARTRSHPHQSSYRVSRRLHCLIDPPSPTPLTRPPPLSHRLVPHHPSPMTPNPPSHSPRPPPRPAVSRSLSPSTASVSATTTPISSPTLATASRVPPSATPSSFQSPAAPPSGASAPSSSDASPGATSTLDAATLPRLLHPSLAHLRDVTLIPAKSPSRTVRAHRFVLAASSPVFRASLSADPSATVLTLAHADADALHAAIQYIYGVSESIDRLPAHALWTALATCVSYALTQPLDAVQRRLVDTVDLHNVFYHWSMADKYALDAVQAKCRVLVKSQFGAVTRQPEFLDVCASRLARVLRIHDLAISSEDEVFQALERWFAFDIDARADQALQLLRLVRLPTMPDRVLLRVCRSPYFGGHNEFYQLLLEALIRRTEVRIVHAPRIATIVRRCRTSGAATVPDAAHDSATAATLSDTDPAFAGATSSTTTTAAAAAVSSPIPHPNAGLTAPPHPFVPLGVTDNLLLPSRTGLEGPAAGGQKRCGREQVDASGLGESVDYNRKEDRCVLFEGAFPLRWYKSVRFRPRSSTSLLFTVVVPKWSTCRRRFISESRSFRDHKWSLWVDPFSSDATRGSRDPRDWTMAGDRPGAISGARQRQSGTPNRGSSTPFGDDSDYISIYLCCESELATTQTVNARVDFALFVASSQDDFGMERKVCVGRTFRSHGQAMGFRRHVRRSRLLDVDAALFNREKDELVVGAHIVAADGFQRKESLIGRTDSVHTPK